MVRSFKIETFKTPLRTKLLIIGTSSITYSNNSWLQINIESLGARYISPVNPAIYPHLALVLLAIGLFFTAWFFVYEVTSTKFTRELIKEVSISIVASIFMGFGSLFLILWVGIYVWRPPFSNKKNYTFTICDSFGQLPQILSRT